MKLIGDHSVKLKISQCVFVSVFTLQISMMKSLEEQSRKYRFNLRHLLFNKTIIKKRQKCIHLSSKSCNFTLVDRSCGVNIVQLTASKKSEECFINAIKEIVPLRSQVKFFPPSKLPFTFVYNNQRGKLLRNQEEDHQVQMGCVKRK